MTERNSPGSHEPSTGQGSYFSKTDDIKTILLLGSGALKIGEAGEFDYSGSQAIKAFKEEGKRVILVNPNIATNQTSWGLADGVYFVPVNKEFVLDVIKKESPDAIALSFGGQTALNCGIDLHESGILSEHGVQVLGTPIRSIQNTEDRALFNAQLKSIGIAVPRSKACESLDEALAAAEEITYPVIVRGAYALGGKGSGRAKDVKELKKLCTRAFVESPQILVEEDLTGWKEIEYEVVRDRTNNCITVCNMENVDPLGIHTGESIVVAPSQTLNNSEYHMLRSVSLTVIRHLGIVGECNIQFALDPHSMDYRVIEVNARLSRSSALASKATGYPLAFVAAKLALGYTLPELKNAVTKSTCTDFEPALDYVAVKVPRWDLQKFHFVSHQVTSEMKSVGEVMALGRSFEEGLQKALRMLNIGAEGLLPTPFTFDNIEEELKNPTPRRIFAVARALSEGKTPEEINTITGIDHWFLKRIQSCTQIAHALQSDGLTDPSQLATAKRLGFSDRGLGILLNQTPQEVRAVRLKHGVTPVIKQIDTLAGEFPAQTNYLYYTYCGTEHDGILQEDPAKQRVIVLGGGPYSIGSSVEFDWCCVQAAHELQKQGYDVTMINSNPETVSTDYDECQALIFDELTEERILDAVDLLNPIGVVVSMGGQIPNSVAAGLAAAGVPILGTSSENIDRAEDRNKFSALLDEMEVDQPEWKEFSELSAALSFANDVGYPVIVRPSYVLSGAAMVVVHCETDLESYVQQSAFIDKKHPVVISKFEIGAKEIEFDGVAQNGNLLLYAIGEHIENAGVHSGDATIVMPPQRVNLETLRRIKVIAKKIVSALDISGPFNIQLLAKNNRLKVIECNLRASRSFPFASKVTGINFITLATQSLLHTAPENQKYQTVDLDYVGVKAAQFSFSRLQGADPRLGVEMASTGEVACFGLNAEDALLTALKAVGFTTPNKNVLLSIGGIENKVDMLQTFKSLHELGFSLYATAHTHEFLEGRSIPSVLLYKLSQRRQPNIREYLEQQRIDLVINIPSHSSSTERTDGYHIRRLATDQGIPLITNVQLAKRLIEALSEGAADRQPLLRWPDLIEK